MANEVASLIAKITADTSGLMSGLASAKNALTQTGAQMKQMGGSFPGDTLGQDFVQFTNKVNAGTQAVNAQGMSLLSLATKARTALGVLGFITGAIASTKVVYEMGRMGAEIDYTATKFDRLARQAGSTGTILLEDLRVATKGTVSDFGLLQQGSDLLQLGLAKDADEAVRLSRVMTALGMDTGEMTLALANQSKRRLDQLGLSLTEFNKYEAALKRMGLSGPEAFKQAFLQTAEATVERVGNRADTTAGSYSRLTASWENYTSSVKRNLSDTFVPLNEALSKGLNLQAKQADANREYAEYMQTHGRGLLPGPTAGHPYGGAREMADLYPGTQAYNLAAMEFYEKQRRLGSGSKGGAGVEVGQDTTNYENLLKVGLALTDASAKYSSTLSELNAKLALAEEKYGENSDKVNALRRNIVELKNDSLAAFQEMSLATLKNNGATDQQQIGFARASGMITESAFQQSMALSKLSDAYLSGKISAGQMDQAVKGLFRGMQSMDGFNAVGYVDIYIRVHGGMQGVGVSVPGEGIANFKQITGTVAGLAAGGPAQAFRPYQVTEYGDPEILNVNGQQILMMGSKSGYVEPVKRGAAGGTGSGRGMEELHALLSRMPSEDGIGKAVFKAMQRAGWA